MHAQTAHNLLLTLLMTLMGLVANVFHTLADRLAMFTGRPASAAGFMVSVYAAGSLVSVLLTSGLSDRVGKRRMLAVSMAVMAAGLLLISRSAAEVPLLLGLFLFGFGFAPAEAMASALVGDENAGKSGGWMNVVQAGFGVGAIAGPLIAAAWLAATGQWQGAFLISMGATLAVLLLMRNVKRAKLNAGCG